MDNNHREFTINTIDEDGMLVLREHGKRSTFDHATACIVRSAIGPRVFFEAISDESKDLAHFDPLDFENHPETVLLLALVDEMCARENINFAVSVDLN